MKHILFGATLMNGFVGGYNMIFASMSWGVFNFTVAALCAYSYLQLEE